MNIEDQTGSSPNFDQGLSDHFLRRAVEAYGRGDIESFENATQIYDEMNGEGASTPVFGDVEESRIDDSLAPEEQALATSVPDKLGFVVSHDGTQPEVSEKEQAIIAKQFSSLVQDVLLNHADQVEHFEHGIPSDSIYLFMGDESEVGWSISVEKKTSPRVPNGQFEDWQHLKEIISIQKIEDHYGRDYFSYRLGGDGVVHRWTGGDMYAKSQQERAMGLDPEIPGVDGTNEEIIQALQKRLETLREGSENSKLQKQMGVNNQPISMDEFIGLRDFITQPGIRVRFERRVTV